MKLAPLERRGEERPARDARLILTRILRLGSLYPQIRLESERAAKGCRSKFYLPDI